MLDRATCERVRGAFAGRGLEFGDAVFYVLQPPMEGVPNIWLVHSVVGDMARLVSYVDPQDHYAAPQYGAWVPASECILIPSLEDVLEALRARGYTHLHGYYGEYEGRSEAQWVAINFDLKHQVDSKKADTPLQAAVACLVKVLEATP